MPETPIVQTFESSAARAGRLEVELREAFVVRRNLEAEIQRLKARFTQTVESLKLDWANRDARGRQELLLEIQNAVFQLMRRDVLRDKPWRNKDRAREMCALIAEVWGLMCSTVIESGAISCAEPPARGGGLVALAVRFDVLRAAQAEEDAAELRRPQAEKAGAKAVDTLPISREEAELFYEALDHLPGFVDGAQQEAMLSRLRVFLRPATSAAGGA